MSAVDKLLTVALQEEGYLEKRTEPTPEAITLPSTPGICTHPFKRIRGAICLWTGALSRPSGRWRPGSF